MNLFQRNPAETEARKHLKAARQIAARLHALGCDLCGFARRAERLQGELASNLATIRSLEHSAGKAFERACAKQKHLLEQVAQCEQGGCMALGKYQALRAELVAHLGAIRKGPHAALADSLLKGLMAIAQAPGREVTAEERAKLNI